jgi:hypothetical protein
MPPGEIILLILLAFGSISGLGYGAHRVEKRLRLRKLRNQGRRNAIRTKEDAELICDECDKEVNPAVDVYDDETWWHVSCYKKEMQ